MKQHIQQSFADLYKGEACQTILLATKLYPSNKDTSKRKAGTYVWLSTMRLLLTSIALSHAEGITLINSSGLLDQHRRNITTRLQWINWCNSTIWHGISLIKTLRGRLPKTLGLAQGIVVRRCRRSRDWDHRVGGGTSDWKHGRRRWGTNGWVHSWPEGVASHVVRGLSRDCH